MQQQMENKLFPGLYHLWVPRYRHLNIFLELNVSFVTFDRLHFQHSGTYDWKALKEYLPNIYGFMGQNLSVIYLNSLIIYSISCEIKQLTLSTLKFHNLQFEIRVNSIYILVAIYQQMNKILFPGFQHLWIPRYQHLNIFLELNVSFVTFDRLHFQHSATYCWRALNEYFPNIYCFMG